MTAKIQTIEFNGVDILPRTRTDAVTTPDGITIDEKIEELVQRNSTTVPNTRKINGKALSTDVTLNASDLGIISFYGKHSQMSGGSGLTGSAQNGVIPFSVEDRDDFNAINLSSSYSRIVIPNGVSVVKFYWRGKIQFQTYQGNSAALYLRKNGVNVDPIVDFTYAVSNSGGYSNREQIYETAPIACVPGDYFEVYASLTTSSSIHSSIVAGSKFGMEVLA